ncbi:diacylglycerol kinase family lipid kinase [Erysipelothrix sp. HDW6C]|uniref:diacylglycerol/lipid kinase family protein n=1 Tax=Erysipelothrix sp. HDW6C TaxID=2714930 RepID=UPI00140C1A22|nr:diacylglycerol kinase family protein [Erysipelothrix sp. HDW6C]QIK69385.1 diacylglycerol kinase family lipid kinase [Erysipelothrix sp. HDW6C]
MKHVFIINPISGLGKYKDAQAWVEDYFAALEDEVEIRFSEYAGHAKEIASEYHGDVVLYAVGGDGTAHEVLNGMDLDVQLAIIPVGTGNDFWRMIGADKKDLKKVLKDTVHGVVRNIDVGEANGHRFLNSLNVGLDSEVNKHVNAVRSTLFPRTMIYGYYAIVELLKRKKTNIEVTVDGVTTAYETILTSIMNGKWYGGGFKSAPLAEFDDGLLEVTIVDSLPLYRIPRIFPMYFQGKHLGLDVVHHSKLKALTIKSPIPLAVGFDGEVYEYDTIDIRILEGQLKLRLPA